MKTTCFKGEAALLGGWGDRADRVLPQRRQNCHGPRSCAGRCGTTGRPGAMLGHRGLPSPGKTPAPLSCWPLLKPSGHHPGRWDRRSLSTRQSVAWSRPLWPSSPSIGACRSCVSFSASEPTGTDATPTEKGGGPYGQLRSSGGRNAEPSGYQHSLVLLFNPLCEYQRVTH